MKVPQIKTKSTPLNLYLEKTANKGGVDYKRE